MTIAIIETRPRPAPIELLRAVPLWAWTLLAVAATTVLAVLAKGPGRAFEFIDSDDALRLIHVRELLAGAPWLEVTTKALGGTDGLVSHWSRLIDGPLALLLGLLRLVLPDRVAQNAVVTIWPMLMLCGVMWAIARATLQVRGLATALVALALAALSVLTYYQFAPGRIDHHNAMIAATISAVMLIWAWPSFVSAWRWSGVLCAIALAIGYEALAPVFVVAAMAAGWGLFDRRVSRQAAGFVTALAATLAVVLVATVSPAHWLAVRCDALGLNLVALSAIAGGGFACVMWRGHTWSLLGRFGLVAASGAAGIAAFGWLEPVCLGGPMAQVPAALGPIWIAQVEEAKSLLVGMLRGEVGATLAPLLILAVSLGCVVAGLVRSARPTDRFLLVAAIGFIGLALWQTKFLAYASLIAVPGIAVLIAGLPAAGEVRAPLVRLGAMLLLNQFALFALAMTVKGVVVRAPAPAVASTNAGSGSPQHACTGADALRALAAAPPGLVVTHNDIGAHLAAATPHRALSGPYHRIPDAIVANHAILSAGDAGLAGRGIARVGADYVLACRPLDVAQIARPGWDRSLLSDLAAGRTPSWLVPVPLADASIYRLWRVDRSRLPHL